MSQIPGPAAGSTSTQPQPGTTSPPGQTTAQSATSPSQGSYYNPNAYSGGVYNPSVPSTTNMSPGGSGMGYGSPNYYSPGPMASQSPGMGVGGAYGACYGGQRVQQNTGNRGCLIAFGIICCCLIVIGIIVGCVLLFGSSSSRTYTSHSETHSSSGSGSSGGNEPSGEAYYTSDGSLHYSGSPDAGAMQKAFEKCQSFPQSCRRRD